MGHQFIGFFGRRIEANGVIDVVVNRERLQSVGAVNAAAAGVDQVGCFLRSATFEDIAHGDQIRIDVGVRILDGVTNSGLCCQVYHAIEWDRIEELFAA